MATLNAMYKIIDACVPAIDKIIKKTDMIKSMNIIDEFTNVNQRISLINDGLQTQVELQDKIFKSANRSRMPYSNMANDIAKMGMSAGKSFKNNDEIIAFTELTQKTLKLGGTDSSDQSSTMMKLSQAMATGNLKGDQFTSIIENAPMIGQAIENYTGKSESELKEMSSEGLITSDIIKNAMFSMTDEINNKFNTMPMTFNDIWNNINNVGTRAFSGVMIKINELINTDQFQSFINTVVNGFYIIAEVANIAIDIISGLGSFIASNWGIIEPVLWGVIAALIVYNATSGIAYLKTLQQIGAKIAKVVVDWLEYAAIFALIVAQDGLNAAIAACPITWIIIAVIVLIALFYAVIGIINKLAGTSISATGVIAGTFMLCLAYVGNRLIFLWNLFADFANFIGNLFNNPTAAIKVLFLDMAVTVLGYMENLAQGIEDLLNKIPGIEVSIVGNITSIKNKLADASSSIKDEADFVEFAKKIDFIDYGDAYNAGYEWGSKLEDKFNLGALLNGLGDNGLGESGLDDILGNDFGIPSNPTAMGGNDFGTQGNPMAVEGTGNNGAVDVNMADEDLQYLRDIAEREYINKFSTATLAPNIQVTFGDVHEEADANKVAGRIKRILQEEIALASEGVY